MNKPWRRIEVHGDSMRPTLRPGDRLLIVWWPRAAMRPGQLVAVRRPDRIVVKRVAAVTSATVDVAGDNPAASSDYAAVPKGDVLGRAVYRYAPDDRVGRLH